jgi:hypothetical protein
MTEIDGYEVLGLGQYFEDLRIGRKFRTIGRTLTDPIWSTSSASQE